VRGRPVNGSPAREGEGRTRSGSTYSTPRHCLFTIMSRPGVLCFEKTGPKFPEFYSVSQSLTEGQGSGLTTMGMTEATSATARYSGRRFTGRCGSGQALPVFPAIRARSGARIGAHTPSRIRSFTKESECYSTRTTPSLQTHMNTHRRSLCGFAWPVSGLRKQDSPASSLTVTGDGGRAVDELLFLPGLPASTYTYRKPVGEKLPGA
jgi:hypothetical protein